MVIPGKFHPKKNPKKLNLLKKKKIFTPQMGSQVRSQNRQNDHFRGVGQTIFTFLSHTEYVKRESIVTA